MEKKDIVVNGKKFQIHELMAIEEDEMLEIESTTERIKKMVLLCSGISEEDYKELTAKERNLLLKEMNKLNGLTDDFQIPQEAEKTQ